MLTLLVLVALSKPEVNNVNIVFGIISGSNQKIIGFDISVNYSLIVHFFDSLNHLNCNAKDSL